MQLKTLDLKHIQAKQKKLFVAFNGVITDVDQVSGIVYCVFGKTLCFYLQPESQYGQKMKIERFSETSVNFYQIIWRYVHKSENLLKEKLFKLYKWKPHTGVGRNCKMGILTNAAYDMIYLLTAIGLSPGGSTHLHTNTTQKNTNNNQTTLSAVRAPSLRVLPWHLPYD
jgi:hypothetical protein